MSRLPSFQEIRRHIPLVLGALALTQVPALPLLLLNSGGINRGALCAYLFASVVAAFGLCAIGLAYWERIARVVDFVRGYAEERRLPHLRQGEMETASVQQVKASLNSLDQLVRSLESEAAMDPLTGILNRRTCSARLDGDLARARRSATPFTIAVFDLDDLKSINDRHGHAAGDIALRHIAQTLKEVTREGDWVARWGGDEFLLGLWSADQGAAIRAAERIIEHLRENPITLDGQPVVLGTSVGIAQAIEGDDPGTLFGRADAALLESKRDGRGRVSFS